MRTQLGLYAFLVLCCLTLLGSGCSAKGIRQEIREYRKERRERPEDPAESAPPPGQDPVPTPPGQPLPPMKTHKNVSYRETVLSPESDRHVLDIYVPAGAQFRPVWLYVHGGAWATGNKERALSSGLAEDMMKRGYVVVAPSYRFTPPSAFPANVQDIAAAIAWVHQNIEAYGGDPDQIFVMGHSAGAHLVSLAVVDASYLAKHGLKPQQLRGVVALDTQAYNLERLASQNRGQLPPLYARAFGEKASVRKQASPSLSISADVSLPPFAIGFSGGKRGRKPEERRAQAELFAQAIRSQGGRAVVVPAPTTTHQDIMNNFGDPSDPVTIKSLKAIRAPEGAE